MSVYLSDWLDGPEITSDFLTNAYNPTVKCEKSLNDSFDSVMVTINLFDPTLLTTFLNKLSRSLAGRFMSRFVAATDYICKLYEINTFLNNNLSFIYKSTDYDLDETSAHMSDLLDMYITDFEFWRMLNILEIYLSLIFYGTPYDPKPLFFVIPPMSEWDNSFDGWYSN